MAERRYRSLASSKGEVMGISDCAFCGHSKAEHGNVGRVLLINPDIKHYDFMPAQCFAEIITRYEEHREYGYSSKIPIPMVVCLCHEYIDPLDKLASKIVELMRKEV